MKEHKDERWFSRVTAQRPFSGVTAERSTERVDMEVSRKKDLGFWGSLAEGETHYFQVRLTVIISTSQNAVSG